MGRHPKDWIPEQRTPAEERSDFAALWERAVLGLVIELHISLVEADLMLRRNRTDRSPSNTGHR